MQWQDVDLAVWFLTAAIIVGVVGASLLLARFWGWL
jgi:hypothetical protein